MKMFVLTLYFLQGYYLLTLWIFCIDKKQFEMSIFSDVFNFVVWEIVWFSSTVSLNYIERQK